MIDISLWEIIVVVIVAVLIIRPHQLPSVARNLGRWLRYFKNLYASFSTEVNKQIQIESEKDTLEKKHKGHGNDEG